MSLNEQERSFALAYVKHGQVLPALEEAGIKPLPNQRPHGLGRRLLHKQEVKDYIAKLNNFNFNVHKADADRLLREFMEMLEIDIGHVLSWQDGEIHLRDLETLPPVVRKCISEVTRNKDGSVKVKLVSRLEMMNTVARIMGLFREETLQVNIGTMTVDPATLQAVTQNLLAKAQARRLQVAP